MSLLVVLLLVLVVTGVAWWFGVGPIMTARSRLDRALLDLRHDRAARAAGRGAHRDPQRLARPLRGRAATDRARPARRCPGPVGRARDDPRDGRRADGARPGGGPADPRRGAADHRRRARRPARRRTRDPSAGARRPRAAVGARGAGPRPGAARRGHRLVRRPARRRPVESAVYFAVAECLANVGKHADAAHAWVELDARRRPASRVVVGDDGRGGADPGPAPGCGGSRDGWRPSTAR